MTKPQIAALDKKSFLYAFDKISLYGNSHAKITYQQTANNPPQITVSGNRDFLDSKPATSDTIFEIASISKQHTSAAMIKLWDMELSESKRRGSKKIYFPQEIDTPIENFLHLLKARFPECNDFFDKMGKDAWQRITIRNLLNHTHGMGMVETAKLEMDKTPPNQPLPLTDIINATKILTENMYGKFNYSNFGCDFSALIIEAIAANEGIADDFDQAMKAILFKPLGLNDTYSLSDFNILREEQKNIAISRYINPENFTSADANLEEIDFNTKLVTRASAGIKTSVKDLAKFAKSFMSAAMFENEEVKQTVLDRSLAAESLSFKGDGSLYEEGCFTYHLGIKQKFHDRCLGHSGGSMTTNSDLEYDPINDEVRAYITSVENISLTYAQEVFANIYSKEDCDKLEKMKSFCGYFSSSNPFLNEDEKQAKFFEIIQNRFGEEGLQLAQSYSLIIKDVLECPRQNLVDIAKKADTLKYLIQNAKLRLKNLTENKNGTPSASPHPTQCLKTDRAQENTATIT